MAYSKIHHCTDSSMWHNKPRSALLDGVTYQYFVASNALLTFTRWCYSTANSAAIFLFQWLGYRTILPKNIHTRSQYPSIGMIQVPTPIDSEGFRMITVTISRNPGNKVTIKHRITYLAGSRWSDVDKNVWDIIIINGNTACWMSAMLVRLADGLTAPHSQKQQGELYSNFGYGSTNIINGSITIMFMRIIVIVNENKLLAFRLTTYKNFFLINSATHAYNTVEPMNNLKCCFLIKKTTKWN